LHEDLNTVAKEHWTSDYLMEHEIERFGKHYSYDLKSITLVVKETTFITKKYTTKSINVSSSYISNRPSVCDSLSFSNELESSSWDGSLILMYSLFS